MSEHMRIAVLLATFNGERHVGALLDSLLQQTVGDFHVIARDDGSSDGTAAILRSYASKHPERFSILPPGAPTGSACGNFAALLDAVEASYVAFADQDDLWFPHKLATMLDRMRAVEGEVGPDVPVLVHSDLQVVDDALRPVAPSYWRLQGTTPTRRRELRHLLAENVVTGCAMLANRALVTCARPVPSEAVMHDWWLALHAAAFGRVEPLPEPTLLYRRHAGNSVGAGGWSVVTVWRQIRRMRHPFDATALHADLRRACLQADAFLRRHGGRLTPRQRAMVGMFAALLDQPPVRRRATLLRWGIGRSHRLRHISLLVRI